MPEEPKSPLPPMDDANAMSDADAVPPTSTDQAPTPLGVAPSPTPPAPAAAPSPTEQTSASADAGTTPVVPTAAPTTPPAPAAGPVVMRQKAKKPLVIGVIVAVLVLLGLSGGYVFGFYIPNMPDNVYKAGMTNTGALLDNLVTYSKDQESAHYKSATLDGSLKMSSAGTTIDASLTGAADSNGNATATLTADVMGQHATVDLRSVHASGNASPDIYLQANGLKTYLDAFGLGSLDGQWVSIDHTLLDSYKTQLGSSNDLVMASTAPTYTQVQDAIAKVQAVNKQYLFTDDSSKAVLTESKFVGQEQVGGRAQNHYKVGYTKSHYVAYLDALGAALDQSQLNTWSKAANNGKNLSEVVNIAGAKQDAQGGSASYTFDLWVDVSTKLVSKVSATNPDDASQVLTLTQGYVSGTNYPMSFGFKGNSDGQKIDMTLSAALDTSTHKVTVGLSDSQTASDGTTTVDLTLHVTPSTKTVTVTAPADAQSLTDLLTQVFAAGSTDELSALSL